jgi:glycine/betaine/sarcosine/D-proline reductase family selenoprotein B
MTKELEREGIPTALIGALPAIAIAANANRVVRGVQVQHPCGDPKLPPEADWDLSLRIVSTALEALQTAVTGPTLFEPPAAMPQERVYAA